MSTGSETVEVDPKLNRVFAATLAFGLVLMVGYGAAIVTEAGSALGYVFGAGSAFLALFVCVEALDVLEERADGQDS